MKFSEKWLWSWVNLQVFYDELVVCLFMVGFEVDVDLLVVGVFSGVVVGEVFLIEQYLDVDKLCVCQVSNGSEIFQVVCGVFNVCVGLKIFFVMIGVELLGDFKIKKVKLCGVEFFGMFCLVKELQISEENVGLFELLVDVLVGQDVCIYLELDDYIIEVGLILNCGDCLLFVGLVCEVSVIYDVLLVLVVVDVVVVQYDEICLVEFVVLVVCLCYFGWVICNVDLSWLILLWMVECLCCFDICSIDLVVDVINYVMIELGQLMYVFDFVEINGGVCVCMVEDGEKLVLFDGQEIILCVDILVIVDYQCVLVIVGVMGGEYSGVSDSICDLFFEVVFFDIIVLVGKVCFYGLYIDFLYCFECGVDSQLVCKVMECVMCLIFDIVGGELGLIVEQVSEVYLLKVVLIILCVECVIQMFGMLLDVIEIVCLL